MDPATIALLALGGTGIASQFFGGQAQQNFQDRQVRDQNAMNRRNAIERAMGGTSIARLAQPQIAPDTSNYALVSGLANLGSNLVAKKYL